MKNKFREALDLIPKTHYSKGVLIIFLLLFSALLDLFSLASFVPLLLLLIKPSSIAGNSLVQYLIQITGLTDPKQFALIMICTVIIFILIKTQINSWIAYKKARYAYGISESIAVSIFSKYLAINYLQFTQTDYTRQMNRISNLPFTFANNFIIPAGNIFAESLLATSLLAVFAIHDPSVFIFLLLVLAPIGYFFRIKKNLIKNTSEEIKHTYPLLLKQTLQAIEGVMEIKIYRKEPIFIKRFKSTYNKLAQIFSVDHKLSTSVSRTTELVAALTIGVLLIYSLQSGKSNSEILFLLGLYAGASFRIIPSVNRIFSAVMQIRTHEYVVEELLNMTKSEFSSDSIAGQIQNISFSFQDKIELRNIFFAYDGQPLILKNASLVIRKGEKMIIQGRSGSGKTTLFLILMRFLKEHLGDILIDGEKTNDKELLALRKKIAYVPQNPYIVDASVIENIAFGIPGEEIQFEKARAIAQSLNLTDWVEGLSAKWNTIIGEKGTRISGGQRQRLAIARALYHEAEIFLLDEITNQLDKESEQSVLNAINVLASQHKTIILITHKTELFENFDSVYELNEENFIKINQPISISR